MTMRSLPTNIYSVAAVRETDRTTIEDHGVPGYTLMSRLLGQQIDGKSSVAPAITAATVTSSRASRRRKVPLFQF
jgi:hypothetical protein